MKSLCAFLMLLFLASDLAAQLSLQVATLDGSAKIQRSTKRTWDDLAKGDKIYDNDIVETFFQTRMVVNYGSFNVVIMGSNSKALFNISKGADESYTNFNTTLFAGGMLIKAVKKTHVGVFTAHGVAQLDSGAISCIVEAKTGNTGFQMLGGSSEVRNIAQQDARQLGVGQTTVIRPGKAPTAPLYITSRHVVVLKHFFGNEYVDDELRASNIKPTEDKSGERPSFSASAEFEKKGGDEGMYSSLFKVNKIYGSILADQKTRSRTYEPIVSSGTIFGTKWEVGLRAGMGVANQGVYPAMVIAPAYKSPLVNAGLRLPLVRAFDTPFGITVKGAAGILDKINHIQVRLPGDSSHVALDNLNHYSLGDGVVVDHFSSANIYSVLRPLGLRVNVNLSDIHIRGFIADVSNGRVGGLHASLTPGLAAFGVGIYYDANQQVTELERDHSRFIAMPQPGENSFRDPGSAKGNARIYELNLGFDLVDTWEARIGLRFNFAQKFIDARTDGIVATLPGAYAEWRRVKLDATIYVETQRMLFGQFHSFYMSNRQRLVYNPENGITTMWTQNNTLSRKRTAQGFRLRFSANPFRGSDLDLFYTQGLGTRVPFTQFENDSTYTKNDFSFGIAFRMNELLFAPISYGEFILQQIHGGYFPGGGVPFGSWGFETILNVTSIPLRFNIALEGGLRLAYIDLDVGVPSDQKFNNNIDAGDLLFELFLGARWGF
jgi:hypothetical protein